MCWRRRNPPAAMPASAAAARCDTRHASGCGRRYEEGRQRSSRRTPRARHGACNHAALRWRVMRARCARGAAGTPQGSPARKQDQPRCSGQA
eukprot:scaffold17702_cov57-Phaeocystis_antarctica.AAC.2